MCHAKLPLSLPLSLPRHSRLASTAINLSSAALASRSRSSSPWEWRGLLLLGRCRCLRHWRRLINLQRNMQHKGMIISHTFRSLHCQPPTEPDDPN